MVVNEKFDKNMEILHEKNTWNASWLANGSPNGFSSNPDIVLATNL